MKHSSRTTCRSGFSLPEILVSLLLVSFVLAALSGLLREATRFYTDQSVTLEVQKNCVIALQKMRKVIRETSLDGFEAQPNSIVAASPRDDNGVVSYDDGRLMWHKFVRFSIQDLGDTSVLLREDDFLDSPVSIPPHPDFSDFTLPDQRSVQAHHLDSLEVTISGGKAEVTIKGRYRDIFEMTLLTEIKLQN